LPPLRAWRHDDADGGRFGAGAGSDAALRLRARAAASVLLALQACVVVPQTNLVYDPECRVVTRRMTLQAAVIGSFRSCNGDGCAVMLAATGAVAAASLVISGSIALVGNVVYWLQRQGECQPAGPATSSSAPSP
jgi:hypothetical protein